MLVAASISLAFKSGIFISAISLAFCLDILATVCFFEFSEPFWIPAAFNNKSEAGGIQKGSENSKKHTVAKISREKAREIAEMKMPDLNANDIEAATNIIAGTARNMGIVVED